MDMSAIIDTIKGIITGLISGDIEISEVLNIIKGMIGLGGDDNGEEEEAAE